MTAGSDTIQTDAGELLLASCGAMRVINLSSRHDRRQEFQQQLQSIGLSWNHPDIALFDAVRPADAGPFPSTGARGCFLSHLGILQQALEGGAETVLICEDDLNFTRDFAERAPGILAALAMQDWAIFYGFPTPDLAGVTPLGGGLGLLNPKQGLVCTHFIAFRRPAVEMLVPYLRAILTRAPGDPEGGPMHVDGAYNWFRASHPQLRTLVAIPALGYQRASRTDIASLSLKDRVPVLRALVGLLRRWKNRSRVG